MAKILSALEVGPKFSSIFSYDAVYYNSNLQYAMEICRTDFQNLNVKETQKGNLLASLKIMHSFNICHFDIKVDNIGWSEAYKKLIFFDFGMTEVVDAPQGFKTKTNFKGTYNFCSPEMKKLYHLKTHSFVDAYYNDLHCLQFSWAQINNIRLSPNLEFQRDDFRLR